MLVNGEAHGREGMNRRELLVRAGSWMKFSWRRSRESLTDTDDYGSKRRHRRHSIDDDDEDDDDDDENDLCCSVKKNVHFNTEEGNEELVITLMPIADEDSIIYEDDIKIRWFQAFDYARFEKDRMLTSFSYINAHQRRNVSNHHQTHSSIPFDETQHSSRGIETLCDKDLGQKQVSERKELYVAIAAEQTRQREDQSYPDFDGFRSVSTQYSEGGKERALNLAYDDARWQQKENRRNNMIRGSSARSLFSRRKANSLMEIGESS